MPKTKVARGLPPGDAARFQERRRFMRNGAALAGATVATAAGIAAARAQRLEIPASSKEMGRIIEPEAYGMPSKFEAQVKRRRSDVLVNRQNWSDWSMTPLQDQLGIVTPNGLFFERHHAGVPDIDPDQHTLVIHGMVKQPLKFSMSDLMRYPSRVEVLFPGVLGQRSHRLDQGRVDHRAAVARSAVLRAMDRHPGIDAAGGSR